MGTFVAPQIPRETVMPATMQTVLIALCATVAALTIAYLLLDARRTRDPLGIYVLIGGALAVLYEPLGDSLVLAYYPEVHQETWISAFGRDIPAFTGLLYFWYMCPYIIGFGLMADRGFTTRSWWAMWAGAFSFAAAFEMVCMALGHPWLYYGKQELVIFDLPLWVPFTYVSFLTVMGAGVYGLRKHLPRRHQWLVIPAVPALLAGGHTAASVPGAAALYSTHDSTVILLGSLGSILMAVLIAWGLSLFFVKRPSAPLPDIELVRRPADELVASG